MFGNSHFADASSVRVQPRHLTQPSRGPAACFFTALDLETVRKSSYKGITCPVSLHTEIGEYPV